MADVPRTIESIIDERARYDTPEYREQLHFVQWCERYVASRPPVLEPHQRKIMDALLDETRKNPVRVLIAKAPRRPGRVF